MHLLYITSIVVIWTRENFTKFSVRFKVFITIKIQIVVFCILTLCSNVAGYQLFWGPCCLHLQCEDGGSMDLWNSILPQHYTASQSRRPPPESDAPFQSQINENFCNSKFYTDTTSFHTTNSKNYIKPYTIFNYNPPTTLCNNFSYTLYNSMKLKTFKETH